MREKILHSSLLMFMKFGIRSVSMDDLSAQLGISKKTLYQYFSDKNSLVLEATRTYFDNERCIGLEIVNKNPNPIDQLLLLYNHILKQVAGFNPNLIYDLLKYHIAAWDELKGYRDHFIRENTFQNLQNGITQGYYRQDIHIEIVTGLYLNLALGVINQDTFPIEKYSLSQVYLQLIELYLRGICTPKGVKYFEQNHRLLGKNETTN